MLTYYKNTGVKFSHTFYFYSETVYLLLWIFEVLYVLWNTDKSFKKCFFKN